MKGQMKKEDKGQKIKVRYIEENEIHEWTIEQILDEINRDRSEDWTDYDKNDWQEGWDSWIEGEGYYSLKDENGKPLNKFKDGGEVDLFETPDKIPAKVQEVLDAFADGIESGEYDVLQKAQEAVEAIGYTFDYDLDGTMSDLRKMGKTESYAKGGYHDEYDKMDGKIKSENKKAEEIKKGLIEEGYKVKSFSKGNYEEDANIELEKGVSISVSLDGMISIVVENSDGTLNFMNCGRSEGMMYNKLRALNKFAKGGETTFEQQVQAIAKKNVGKAVPKSVQKDYGKRYSKKEALDSARRIVGAMKAKGMFK
jgi:hypothetical protein